MRIFIDRDRREIRPAMLLILLFLLFSACGPSQVSLKPEIRGVRPAADERMAGMQRKLAAEALKRELPEMTAAEHEGLGDALLGREDFQGAYLHYQQALALTPDKAGPEERLDLECKKGLALLGAANWKEAGRQFEMVLKQQPGNAPALEGLGRVLLVSGRLEAAKARFAAAIREDGRAWLSYNCLGTIYDREKRWHEAVAAYKTAIGLRPGHGPLYNNLGMSYFLAGNYPLSVNAFRDALRRGFGNERVYNNLGMALAHTGDYQGAFHAFKKAGGEPTAFNNLGCFFMETGAYEKAAACFERAIAAKSSYYVTAGENLKRVRMLSGKKETF